MTNDDEIICDLIRHKEATIAWFGQTGKQERERFLLRGFLRGLEISFDLREIKSVNGEFPDIEFRGAEFEIKEMLDPDRRRHDEPSREPLDRPPARGRGGGAGLAPHPG